MGLILQIILLVLMVSVSGVMLTTMVCILRGAARRRLLSVAGFSLNDAPGGVGISVLYSGTGNAAHVSDMLDVGYGRYELVLVIDARQHPEEFETLVVRYGLIGVCHTLDEELPTQGVRGLYRSRKRCFRRLVVVDKAFTSVVDDLNAAVGVATYDYVLPMRSGWRLMSNAVGRMAAELSEYPSGSIDLVWSPLGAPALLMGREFVIAAGGFGKRPWRSLPHRRRHILYEPLLWSEHSPRHVGWRWNLVSALVLAAGVAGAVVAGWWTVCALLLTTTLAWCTVRVAAPLLAETEELAVDGNVVMGYLVRRFNLGNFRFS